MYKFVLFVSEERTERKEGVLIDGFFFSPCIVPHYTTQTNEMRVF